MLDSIGSVDVEAGTNAPEVPEAQLQAMTEAADLLVRHAAWIGQGDARPASITAPLPKLW